MSLSKAPGTWEWTHRKGGWYRINKDLDIEDGPYSEPIYTMKEFLEAEKEDSNLWWRLSCGQHQNLFEEAVEYARGLEDMCD